MAQTDRRTDRRTWRLRGQFGPEGRVGENIYMCKFELINHNIFMKTNRFTCKKNNSFKNIKKKNLYFF